MPLDVDGGDEGARASERVSGGFPLSVTMIMGQTSVASQTYRYIHFIKNDDVNVHGPEFVPYPPSPEDLQTPVTAAIAVSLPVYPLWLPACDNLPLRAEVAFRPAGSPK